MTESIEVRPGALAKPFHAPIAAVLVDGALPGEIQNFGKAARAAAAAFIAETAWQRRPETPAIALESIGAEEEGGLRRMRLAVINRDKPFLVDSIAGTIASFGLAIERLLHPVVPVARDKDGRLTAIGKKAGKDAACESLFYVEIERADAKDRRALVAAIRETLGDVRAAVRDWPKMQVALRADAESLGDTEGAALLRWLLGGNFTQLGHEIRLNDGTIESALGIAGTGGVPVLADSSLDLARKWLATKGNAAPLVVKSNRISSVHRRAPLDVLIVPVVRGGKIAGVSIHSGLWTSAALAAAPGKVPVLRDGLARIQDKYGFSATGHAGKALAHALSELPHDLLIGFTSEQLEETALTAMSLADRPRPALLLQKSPLGRHLFALVWLPRDEVSTARRVAIGAMLADAADATVLSWAMELDDGDVALIRYALDLREGGRMPDTAALDRRLVQMVRGWVPGVEAALGELGEGQRGATRLALRHAAPFPQGYRTAAARKKRPATSLRLAGSRPADRPVAPVPRRERRGAAQDLPSRRSLALSDAVPVLENFGFRVIEEMPTALPTTRRASSTNSWSRHGRPGILRRRPRCSKARSPRCWRAAPRMTRSTG
jgi:glutamate dehydrogenase